MICGDSDGRIFLGGEDGGLYEFRYEPLTSWNRKARKTSVRWAGDDSTVRGMPLRVLTQP